MSDTTTETVEVVVHVDPALRDRRAVVVTTNPDIVEADAVEAWPQSPNGWS